MKDLNKNGVSDILEFNILVGTGIFLILVATIALFTKFFEPWEAITVYGIGSTLVGGEGVLKNIKR